MLASPRCCEEQYKELPVITTIIFDCTFVLAGGVWRYLQAFGSADQAAVQELLVVFEEHLPRSLHSRPQPAPLWLGEITHPHPHPHPQLCLAGVGFPLGGPPEGAVLFHLDTYKSHSGDSGCLNSLHWMLVFHLVSCHCFGPSHVPFPSLLFPFSTVGKEYGQGLVSGCWREQ